MKKSMFIIVLAILISPLTIFAQAGSTPCTAICLSPTGVTTGSTAPADGISPQNYLPCGLGTSEDNPTWFTFITAGNSFTLDFVQGTCSSGVSLQTTIFEAGNCDDMTFNALGCVNCVASGTVNIPSTPGKQYYIQVDGCAEAVCGFTLTYDPKQLLTTAPKPTIKGVTTLCKGIEQDYTLDFGTGLVAEKYNWTINPANSGQIIGANDGKTVKIKWNQDGKNTVSCTPVFSSKCNTIVASSAKVDVNVNAILKDAACSQTFCAEKNNTVFDILSCVKAANPNFTGKINPQNITINQLQGSTQKYSIPFYIDSTACSANFILDATLLTALKTSNATVATYLNIAKVVELKPIILKENQSFKETPIPSKITINELKTGKYLKKIKYKSDLTGCEGNVNLNIWILKKISTLVETNPELNLTQKTNNYNEIEPAETLKVFPNPSNSIFQIDVSNIKEDFEIEVYDMEGKLILKEKNNNTFNLENQPKGSYLLKIKSNQSIKSSLINRI